MRKICSFQAFITKFRPNKGRIWTEFWPNLWLIRFTKNEPNFKPKFGQIRTRIIWSKTNFKEFKTNRIQIRPRLINCKDDVTIIKNRFLWSQRVRYNRVWLCKISLTDRHINYSEIFDEIINQNKIVTLGYNEQIWIIGWFRSFLPWFFPVYNEQIFTKK